MKWTPLHGTTTFFARNKQIIAEVPVSYLWKQEQITEEMGDLLEVFYRKYVRLNGIVTYDWKSECSYQFKKDG